MARVRPPAEPPPPPPVRPPADLLEPYVEDWADLDEEPGDGTMCPGNRLPAEDRRAWHLRQAADRRYREALDAFQAEHRGQRLDMTVPERKRWLLGDGPRWRDLPAFLAGGRS